MFLFISQFENLYTYILPISLQELKVAYAHIKIPNSRNYFGTSFVKTQILDPFLSLDIEFKPFLSFVFRTS